MGKIVRPPFFSIGAAAQNVLDLDHTIHATFFGHHKEALIT